MADRAGNTPKQARRIKVGASEREFKDAVSFKDRDDFYSLKLQGQRSLSVDLSKLQANANLELLNRQGAVIAASKKKGKKAESLEVELDAGKYLIHVSSKGDAKTKYLLTASAIVPTEPEPSLSTFDIQFDYRFDTQNWFTSERRDVLEAAAQIWEDLILDEFANVSIGTDLNIVNPTTGQSQITASDFEIEDLVIFAGAGNTGGALGIGGPSGTWFVGSDLDTRFNSADFEPWTGYISFNPSASWFFDATPDTASDIPKNSDDFLSTAVHEIGHVLGIGTSDAFNNLTSGSNFTGINARSRNGGNVIPLDFGLGHIQEDFVASGSGGEAAMDPSILVGTRKLPTALDIALLNDIGYSVDYSRATINDNPIARFRKSAVNIGDRRLARCACGTCLMT